MPTIGHRVAIAVQPLGPRRIRLDPYPFDQDPLPVRVPVREYDFPAGRPLPHATWWHARPLALREFQACS